MLKSLALGAVAVSVIALSGTAHSATISVSDVGQVNPSVSVPLFGAGVSVTALNNAPIVSGAGAIIGSNGSNSFGNAAYYTDGSIGWDPFGTSSSNQWLSIGGASGAPVWGDGSSTSYATFSFAKPETKLSFVWGSPSINTVSLYGATGNLLGTVSSNGNEDIYASDETGNATGSIIGDPLLENYTSPGAIIDITSSVAFSKAVFTDSTGGFEIGGISAVPLPGALPMFACALAALGAVGARSRKRVAL